MKLLITLALLLAACGQEAPATIPVTTPPTAAPTAAGSPPTTPAAPSPTQAAASVRLTPVPTPTPDPTPVAGTDWLTYSLHSFSASSELASLFQSLRDDGSSLGLIRVYAVRLRSWARTQQSWLSDNPPQPCWRRIHAADADLADSTERFTVGLIRGIDTLNSSLINRAMP